MQPRKLSLIYSRKYTDLRIIFYVKSSSIRYDMKRFIMLQSKAGEWTGTLHLYSYSH